ncbi:FAD/NAD(P)-binding domain-containing protein [Clathrospora elynae]|uniref:FAD/NAD(P)-binding domain-containing protein n=1 Tax=Clathrospora elynae TaxID=706981 RepID=A0A6A5S4P3_9PLEO|nr:FAD/NAD(P)-binding domain-containing protein [Clathrospora elynae]
MVQILIVGGSITGLMVALCLRSLGYNIRILETRDKLQSEAGLSLGPDIQKLLQQYVPWINLDSVAVQNTGCVFYDSKGEVSHEVPLPGGSEKVMTSTWDAVYHLLLKDLEAGTNGHGQVWLDFRCHVIDVREEGEQMKVKYQCMRGEGKNERVEQMEEEADLVIGADGANSTVRRMVLPELKAEYAGYLAWRGEFQVPNLEGKLKSVLEGKLGFLKMAESKSYILLYAKPSKEQSKHLVEWCWYYPCEKPSEYLKDKDGLEHQTTVTPDRFNPDVWKKHLASTTVPLWIKPSLEQCKAPLLSAITSLTGEQSVFFGGRLILLGDALCQLRPHLGESSNVAAHQVIQLVEAIRGKALKDWDLEIWEKYELLYAQERARSSKKAGEGYMG